MGRLSQVFKLFYAHDIDHKEYVIWSFYLRIVFLYQVPVFSMVVFINLHNLFQSLGTARVVQCGPRFIFLK